MFTFSYFIFNTPLSYYIIRSDIILENILFKGTATALATPFNKEGINYLELKRLIEFQIKEGINALVVNGTTGESSTLSLSEKKEVIKFTVDITESRIPVIAGTGGNNTNDVISLSKYAESCRCRWTFNCNSILQ